MKFEWEPRHDLRTGLRETVEWHMGGKVRSEVLSPTDASKHEKVFIAKNSEKDSLDQIEDTD